MGARDTIQARVAAALNRADQLGDASKPFELENSTTQVKTSGRGWREDISMLETDNESVQISDIKFSCLQNELSVTPEIDDILHIGTNEHYIYKVSSDPADATWTMWARG